MTGPVPVASQFLFQIVGEQHIELMVLRARVAELEQQVEQAKFQSFEPLNGQVERVEGQAVDA